MKLRADFVIAHRNSEIAQAIETTANTTNATTDQEGK
jgi:hypothetical protein